jgi:hypothetical protein
MEAYKVEDVKHNTLLDNRLTKGGKVDSSTHRQHFTPQKYNFSLLWYSVVIEAEWTPLPSAARRIRLIEIFNLPHRVWNPQTSGLYRSALITKLIRVFVSAINAIVRRKWTSHPGFWVEKKNENSVAWVRKWTVPTERPPLVCEVSANFYG